MCELNEGLRSAEDAGWISEAEFTDHFRSKGKEAK